MNTAGVSKHIFASHAPAYISTEWHIAPIGRKHDLQAKAPGIWQPHQYYYEAASNTRCQILAWCQSHPEHNIGICLRSHQIVLDPEDDQGLSILAANAKMSPEALLMSTRSVRTGGGGHHLYFYTEGYTLYKNNRIKYDGEELPIDVKTWRGFVMAPYSVSHKGPYVLLHDVPPIILPRSLHAFLARAGKVRLGPGAEPDHGVPLVVPIAWDHDEDAGRITINNPPPAIRRHTQNTKQHVGITSTCWPDFDDKLQTALRRWPINISKGLNRDTQISDAARSLVRRYRRSHGREFIHALLQQLVRMQLHNCHQDTTLQQAYQHVDHRLQDAWTATDPQGELLFDGLNEQDYIDIWINYTLPEHVSAQNTKQHVGIQSAQMAMLKIAYHELFEARKPDINFTQKQYGGVFGCTRKATIRSNMRRYITVPGWHAATDYELLIEIAPGRHGAGGKGIPGKYRLGKDIGLFLLLENAHEE